MRRQVFLLDTKEQPGLADGSVWKEDVQWARVLDIWDLAVSGQVWFLSSLFIQHHILQFSALSVLSVTLTRRLPM